MTGPALALALRAARSLLDADREAGKMTRAELVALVAAYRKVLANLTDALGGPGIPSAGDPAPDADVIPIWRDQP